ncbi:hypothetical protein [Halosegnis sp.]|uniref:DUF7543 family protein n=1 Tax=Halosegnis sp. TaxID=2864959 RepID=UPI0035D4E4BA
MEWQRVQNEPTRVEWERGDGHARLLARETARGEWVVSLDRLEQAPEGSAYRHERVSDRAQATALAAEWRADG